MRMAIFYAERRPTLDLLQAAARNVGFKVTLVHWNNVEVTTNAKSFRISANGIPLSHFDCFFLRELRAYVTEVLLILQWARKNKIPMIDAGLLDFARARTNTIFQAASRQLPTPKTFFLKRSDGPRHIIRVLRFPIVAKGNRGRQGKDVHLLRTKKELEHFYKKNTPRERTFETPLYFFQEFIPNDGDVRVLVIGNQIIGAIRRCATKYGEFRHNVALGATALPIEVTAQMRALALRAARTVHVQFAGVDLIANKETGQYYVLEVNRSPEFIGFMKATGVNVADKVMRYALRYFKKKLS